MNPVLITALAVFLVIFFVLWLLIVPLINLWLRAYFSKANITFAEIVGMRFRKTNIAIIVVNKIRLLKVGIKAIETADLEIHYLSGGNVGEVVSALIAAHLDGQILNWKALTTHDLKGHNVLELVHDAIQSGDYTDLEPLRQSPNPEIESPQPAI